ncbi:T9SS type A sorting domain-containing protein [Flavobacterium gawalongense]|uniref:T9SS type A sorting domain-containing protein n=1 Tax=Flavobacterium gawalongense TaxID=2594432 RepID=A0ABY3CPS5_9FLAO|nr:T9SS type A sorting domain-containing protein [Flavobacterium gawalongense]TRX03182.1 T9SS type A sorting domain-containing protein [Flavobacterium gawalongense]TRX09844.1 T9SS type A sorting domain-containing protein [Flavobacterium gawalongense]
MKTFLLKSGFLTIVFLIANLFFASVMLGQATVSTDLLDYPPGSTAIITGSGFQAGEYVELHVHHADGDPLGSDPQYHEPFYATADVSGNFTTSWYVPLESEGDAFGATFNLEAHGNMGSVAEWTFTDGPGTVGVVSTPTAVCAGSTGNSLTFTFSRPNGTPNVYGTGSQATMVVPSVWTAPQTISAASPGFISVAATGGASAPSIASITGSGPWTITINFTSTSNGHGFALTYAGGGSKVTAPSADSYTFTTQTKQGSTGAFSDVTGQPIVTVSIASPATPGAINQPNICVGTGRIFSISAVSGATSYTWSVTGTGWSVTSGGTTTSATITIGSGVGSVSVTASNGCGTSSASTTGNITPTTTPAIPGAITQPTNKCAGSSGNVFSISPVSGATSYTWSVTGTGWSVTAGATTTSATITIGSGVGTVSVTATNACGTSSPSTTGNITPTTTPAIPGAITQPTNKCAGSSGNVFSISPVSGATSYTWSVTGTGWSVTSGGTTTSATITIGSGVGTVSVTATNACGTSGASTTGNITPTTAAATPGAIIRPTNECSGSTGNIYSISAVSGATSYSWSVTGTGWSVTTGGTTTSATITIGSGVGTVSVTATNACGTSGASTTGNITPTTAPETPGAITGSPSVCASVTGVTYSISAVSGATSYIWSVPSGASITSGQGTTSITVTFGSTSGNISVTANNACGTSAAQTNVVLVNPRPTGVISGTQTICNGNSAALSIAVTGIGPWSGTLSNGQAFSGSSSPINVTVSAAATYTIATLSDVNCNANAGDKTGSAIVTVRVTPTATIAINGSNPICSGSTTSIKFSGPDNGIVTYNINEGSNLIVTLNNGGNETISTGVLSSSVAYNLVSVKYGDVPDCTASASGSAIVTVNQLPIITCPANSSTSSCSYANQAALDSSYSTWLASASATNGTLSNNSTGAPNICGGTTTVTFTSTSNSTPACGFVACSATFAVTAAPALVTAAPDAVDLAACTDATAIQTAYDSWAAGVTAAPDAVDLAACTDATAIQTAYDSWAAGFTVADGCSPTSNILDIPALPATFACDGADLSFELTANNATGKCVATSSKSSTFKIGTAPLVVLTVPLNKTEACCQSQSAINISFSNWLASVTYSGGCNLVVTNSSTGAPSVCGGGIVTVVWTAKSNCGVDVVKSSTFTVTPTTLSASISTNNPTLYFGYAGDQTATITAYPSGGTAPYKVSITMVNPQTVVPARIKERVGGKLICDYINTAGDEVWVPGTNTYGTTGNSGNNQPTSTSNANIPTGGSYSVNVTLLTDARFVATVTDKYGCSYTIQYDQAARVDAEDARCFAAGNSGNAKVTICHRTGSTKNPCVAICVNESAVQEHLNHGDFLGKCIPDFIAPKSNAKLLQLNKIIIEPASFDVKAYPNPTQHQFTLVVEGDSNEKVEVIVYDMLARMVKRFEKSDGQLIMFGEELPTGEYLTVIKQGVNIKTVNLIKQ